MIDPNEPVSSPADFVGQYGLVRKIYSRIGAERPQSVAVIGGTRSGKTSLLSYLANPEVAGHHLNEPQRYLFHGFRAAPRMTDGPDSFLAGFAARLGFTRAADRNLYDELRAKIEELHEAGRRLVVCLDDFHYITSNQRFPLEFFSFLRSMANNYNLAYVTTSFLELQKLCIAKEIQESPFFNIFTNMHLGMLPQADARSLFLRAVPGADASLADRLVPWCGGSPYILKLVASLVENRAVSAASSPADLERVLLPALVPFFKEVLSSVPPEAARPLTAVSREKAPSPADVHHLDALVKQGFLVDEERRPVPACPCFALFLRKEYSPSMLKGSC